MPPTPTSGATLAIGAAVALALAAAFPSRGSASVLKDVDQARLQRLIEIVEEYDGQSLDGVEGTLFAGRLEREGFEIIGAGGTRLVVGLGPNVVAKIDYDPHGTTNEAELSTWLDYRDILDGHVVPVIGERLDSRILLMERARPLTERDRGALVIARRSFPISVDRQESSWDFNWGWHDGAVKLLDYAS